MSNQDWRKTYAYAKWRVQVIRRDRVCKNCGRRKDRHAHHVKNAAHNPDLRFDVENGITLCHRCHWMLHNLVNKSYRHACGEAQLKALRAITLIMSNLPNAPSFYKKPNRKKG